MGDPLEQPGKENDMLVNPRLFQQLAASQESCGVEAVGAGAGAMEFATAGSGVGGLQNGLIFTGQSLQSNDQIAFTQNDLVIGPDQHEEAIRQQQSCQDGLEQDIQM